MNPKGEEGEFYMKKSLLVLASIMILALCTFVACTAEVSDPYDGLTYVTFGGESPASRNLLASYEVASYDDLYWSYSAEKLDHYGTSGAATNAPVFENSTTKGLNNPVGPFSQGKWRFTLCAYTSGTTRNEDTKVYEGSVEVSIKGQKVTVPVSVTPYGETGALKFSGAYFAWKDNAASSTAIPFITIVAEGTTTGQKYTLSNSFTDPVGVGTNDVRIPLVVKDKDPAGKFYIDYKDAESSSVVADFYNCSIIAHIEIEGSQTPIFSQQLGFRVYGSATTVIKGNITEQSGTDVNFDPAKQDMAVFKGATTASVKVTPSGTDTTTVDFGANNLDNTSTYYLSVSATSAASAANKFTVSDSTKAPVAGINLELVKVSSDGSNSEVRNFTGGDVTVTTYIEKDLTGVTVKYNGTDGDNPFGVIYESDTGKLTFKTKHFSEFYAVSDSVAMVSDQNETTEKGYARLVDAFDNSVDGCSIKLLKNIELTESIRIGSSDTRKVLTINLNGKTISAHTKTFGDSLFQIGNAEVLFDGEGILQDLDKYWGEIRAIGSSNVDVCNYTIVTANKGVVFKDGQALWIARNFDGDYINHGVIVNFSGKADLLNTEDFVFYVNGSNKETSNTPVFNINGAMINSPLSRGIYAAGYAVWNIDNTVINSKKAAIEIRAGELNIAGGTFTATADEFSCEANGNGETTVGAAIAVAQHNTKLPINVTISGGTFSGYHALSVMNPQKNEYDAIKEIEVNVSGETLNSTKEGVEDVNYSSEFIKICDGSAFTIRARKDGDEGNVAKLSDGRFFSSLQDAINGAKEDETVTMLTDLFNTSDYSVEGGVNLMIDKNIALDGNSHSIEGNVKVTVGSQGARLSGVKFRNIHNNAIIKDSDRDKYGLGDKTGSLSALYSKNLTGVLDIENCEFDSCDWDSLQVIPLTGASIVIKNNIFRHSSTDMENPMRYIHIESAYNDGYGVDFDLLITGNAMYDCTKLNQTGFEVYFLANTDNVNMQGNYIDAPVGICVYGGAPDKVGVLNPMINDSISDSINNNLFELLLSENTDEEGYKFYSFGKDPKEGENTLYAGSFIIESTEGWHNTYVFRTWDEAVTFGDEKFGDSESYEFYMFNSYFDERQ